MSVLRRQFGKDPKERMQEWQAHQRRLALKRNADAKRKEADKAADNDMLDIAVAIVASTERVQQFTMRLDAFDAKLESYNIASVEALMQENRELDIIKQRIFENQQALEGMRTHAFKLEDGRRIFTNTEGTEAIDLDGNDVSIDDVPVDLVPPAARIADAYREKLVVDRELAEQRSAIEAEIDAIHEFDDLRRDYQTRAEEMRTELEKGDVTVDQLADYEAELEAMDAELLDLMPQSVRARVPGLDTPEQTDASPEPASPSDAAQRPNAMTPSHVPSGLELGS